MRPKRKSYKDGGPIEPNYQTLGNIKFDSNKVKWKKGILVAQDEISKKDYGIIRNANGSYRFYDNKNDEPLDETGRIRSYYKDWIESAPHKNINAGPFEEDVKKALLGEKLQIKNTPVIFGNSKKHAGSHFDPEDNIIYVTPEQIKEFGSKSVIAHELNHARERGPAQMGVPYLEHMNQKSYNYKKGETYDYMDSVENIFDRTQSTHDTYPTEYRSDINAARFLLFDKSIYDPINQPFTKEHFETLKKDKTLYKSNLIDRVIKNSKDEDSFIKAMNELASKENKSSVQNVAMGGHLQNNPMRKRRNYYAGGFTGDPYQLAIQQGSELMHNYDNFGMPASTVNFLTQANNGNPYGMALQQGLQMYGTAQNGSYQTPTPYNTANLPLTRQGSIQPVSSLGTSNTPTPKGGFNDPKNMKGALTGMQMPEVSGGDPYAMAAQYITGIAGDYKNAADYKAGLGAEKSQKDYNKEILMAGITKGPIGMIPSIMRMNKDKNTVVSGSPGTYAFGGPVDPLKPIVAAQESMLTSRPIVQTIPEFNPFTQENVLQNAMNRISLDAPITATDRRTYFNAKSENYHMPTRRPNVSFPKERATGGSLDDQQLSDSAFQVKDDPNVTDGKSYPEYSANLDHNEVVDKNAKFVFSDELNLPGSKQSFAKAVKPLYKKIGNLETRKDPISIATTEQINKQINTLAMTQEELATALGLRNNRPQGMVTGGFAEGPDDPTYTVTNSNLKAPTTKKEILAFQTWYNSIPGGTPIETTGVMTAKTKKAFAAAGNDYDKIASSSNLMKGIPGPISQMLADKSGMVTINPVDGKLMPSSITTQEFPKDQDLTNLPTTSGYSFKNTGQVNPTTGEQMLSMVTAPSNTPRPRGAPAVPNTPAVAPIDTYMKTMGEKYNSQGMSSYTGNQGTTYGDILQGVEVGSKFFNIGQGAEQEKPLLNTSPITKAGYDVNPALYQNQRSFQNNINSIGSASAPQRRALTNSMLATKLNSDNQVLSNYQGMNNQANVQYEDRIGQQRNQNIASMFRTNDMNAANRGAYDQAQQNAFTSLGNFGEAMNRKKMSNDALALLKINYPDIYDSVMQDFDAAGIKRKTKVTTKVG